jgi:hypothetical protein
MQTRNRMGCSLAGMLIRDQTRLRFVGYFDANAFRNSLELLLLHHNVPQSRLGCAAGASIPHQIILAFPKVLFGFRRVASYRPRQLSVSIEAEHAGPQSSRWLPGASCQRSSGGNPNQTLGPTPRNVSVVRLVS